MNSHEVVVIDPEVGAQGSALGVIGPGLARKSDLPFLAA